MSGKAKILVVDDEAVITGAARKILGAEGFEVFTAADAEKALDLLPSVLPEVAFLDLMLPGLSGLDLLGRIRQEFPNTVVIMMTGYSTLENAIAFLQSGAFDYLPKPFGYEELLSTAQRASRFSALRTELSLNPAPSGAPRYLLGMNFWAQAVRDGTVRLGVTGVFSRVLGPIDSIELPELNDEIRQGSLLAHVVARDELRHTVWSALSGRVVELNPRVEKDCDSVQQDPTGEGWLVRIVPEDLENELGNLSAAP